MAISPATCFACSGSNLFAQPIGATAESMSGYLGSTPALDVSLGDRTRGVGRDAWLQPRSESHGTDMSVTPASIQFHENSRQSLPSARRGASSGLIRRVPDRGRIDRSIRLPGQDIGHHEAGEAAPPVDFGPRVARSTRVAGRCRPGGRSRCRPRLRSGRSGPGARSGLARGRSRSRRPATGSRRTSDPAAGSSRAPPPSGRTARRRASICIDVAHGGQLRGKRVAIEVDVQADPDHRAPAGQRCEPGAAESRRPGASTRSTRMPAILRPSIRTSLGHLIVASRPVQAVTTSAVGHRAQRGQPGATERRLGQGRGQVGGRKQHDRHQDRRTGRGGPRPSPATAAGRLLLGQHHQAVVGRRRPRPRGQIVGARDSVPDRDPPADPVASPAHARSGRDRAAAPARCRPRPDTGVARSRSQRTTSASSSQRTPLEVRTQLVQAARNRRPPREGGPEAGCSSSVRDGG